MSERRFVIREIYEGEDPKSIHWVVESELKRRILDILVSIHTTDETDPGWNWRINHLLHGDGKEEPVPRPDEWPHVPFPKKPQPDQWEAWVEEMPTWIGHSWQDVQKYEDSMKDWFRKMPRGK